MSYKSFFIAAMLLSLMPLAVGAQGTEINSRDLRGKVVYQNDDVVFRQLVRYSTANASRPLATATMVAWT